MDAEPRTRAVPDPVFLVGPTASGKSALALPLAEALGAEIVSVDSAQVYRGMDIGTAKPSTAERARVPHHLLDIVEPDDPYSAARFVTDALAAIDDIAGRGRRALLCGGTVLYFNALQHGLADMPPADPAMRAGLVAELRARGGAALHAELGTVDPDAAARIHPNDPQRLLRALEVWRAGGVPLSELQRRTRPALARSPVKIALVPDARPWLHERIAARFAAMVEGGLLDEARALAALPGFDPALPAMRAVGYRQALEHVLGADARADARADSGGDWRAKALAATRQLAKRQLTWLRGMDDVVRLACDALDAQASLEAALRHVRDADAASAAAPGAVLAAPPAAPLDPPPDDRT